MKTKKILLALSIVGLLSATSCKSAKTEEVAKVEEKVQTPNIVEVAVGNENFSTLVAAVKAADLVSTLSSDGPFTVFAPTNDAFAKLPEGSKLIASLDGESVILKDEKGNTSKVIMADVAASNGVIHAIDSVVMPK